MWCGVVWYDVLRCVVVLLKQYDLMLLINMVLAMLLLSRLILTVAVLAAVLAAA